MAVKTLIINTNKESKIFDHFDERISTLAEDHRGTYLIVKNFGKASEAHNHNRFYFHKGNALEFEDARCSSLGTRNAVESSNYFVLTDHPDAKIFIETFAATIKRNETRSRISKIFKGLNIILECFKLSENLPIHPTEITSNHQKIIADFILEGKYIFDAHARYIGYAWSHIREHYDVNNQLAKLPSGPSIEKQIDNITLSEDIDWEDYSDEDNVTLEILFQLDYYTQIEFERIMNRVNEYQVWMRELNEINHHGGLFSQANLLKTFYNDSSYSLINIRNYHIIKFGEDPITWLPNIKIQKTLNGYKHRYKKYPNKEAELRHQKLLLIAENGIDISVTKGNEKMFAWWMATICPNFPLDKVIIDEYSILISSIKNFFTNNATGFFSRTDFSERIVPSPYIAHLMMIRILIDSEANTDTVYNTTVYKKDDLTYSMGEHLFRKRLLNSVKRKNNTVPAAYIDHGSFTDRCIDFYTNWCSKLYNQSKSNRFLQYIANEKINYFDLRELQTQNTSNVKQSNGRRFFERFEIYNTHERRVDIGTENERIVLSKERVHSIKHSKIRAACNYRNYNLKLGEWKRRHVDLGHGQKSESVEREFYRNNAWQLEEDHQLAIILSDLADHITGKVVIKELEGFFSQPHCGCSDNTNPNFKGAPKLQEGEICTDYSHCLTKCDKSTVFADYHGPTHMAIKIIAEQEYENIIRIEDWYKQWGVHHIVAEAVLRGIPLSIKESDTFKQIAFERIPFVRIFLMRNKRKMSTQNNLGDSND
jgi:hypothetical protein